MWGSPGVLLSNDLHLPSVNKFLNVEVRPNPWARCHARNAGVIAEKRRRAQGEIEGAVCWA